MESLLCNFFLSKWHVWKMNNLSSIFLSLHSVPLFTQVSDSLSNLHLLILFIHFIITRINHILKINPFLLYLIYANHSEELFSIRAPFLWLFLLENVKLEYTREKKFYAIDIIKDFWMKFHFLIQKYWPDLNKGTCLCGSMKDLYLEEEKVDFCIYPWIWK